MCFNMYLAWYDPFSFETYCNKFYDKKVVLMAFTFLIRNVIAVRKYSSR
jgi:hypothetical protein